MTSSFTAPGVGALLLGSRRLADLAADVRSCAAQMTAAAAGSGWRSTAASACRTRLGDLGRDLLAAAVLLDHAGDAWADHARVAARRAEALELAAAEVLAAGAREVAGWVLP